MRSSNFDIDCLRLAQVLCYDTMYISLPTAFIPPNLVLAFRGAALVLPARNNIFIVQRFFMGRKMGCPADRRSFIKVEMEENKVAKICNVTLSTTHGLYRVRGDT